jgi:27-O-demethylrifamycin SV methyltransferase
MTVDRAPTYDRLTPAWSRIMGANLHCGWFETPGEDLETATSRLTRRMALLARCEKGSRVLDVGCGVGEPACFLAEEFGCRVTGITTSEIGLARAQRLAESHGLGGRVEFRYADGMDNRLPDAAYDRVWILQAAHLMPSKNRLIAESARVLRPGGRLVLCDIVLGSPMSLREVVEYRHEFLLLERVFGRARMEPLDAYASLAREAGLEVESLEDVSARTLPTFARWRENATRHAPMLSGELGRDGLQAFLEATEVLESFWNAGRLGYGLLAAVKAA